MKKLLNICLLLSSLIGYLEWGKDRHAFLWQVEYELIFRKSYQSETFLHPFVLIPLCGQLLLLFSVFQKTPGKVISFIGLFCLATIMLLVLAIGLMTMKIAITASATPFVITAVAMIVRYRRTAMKQ